MKKILAWAILGFSSVCVAQTTIYDTNNVIVQTFVGSGFAGHVDGQGMQTMFFFPRSIVADSFSNLFVLEIRGDGSIIRKVTPSGEVSTFAGGSGNFLPGYGTNILCPPSFSMTIDHEDNLFLVERYQGLVKIRKDGYASKVPGYLYSDGEALNSLCVDSKNNVYAATGNRIYRWQTNGTFEVFAGSGNAGSRDGNGIFTSFNFPQALAADTADNIYVWDSRNGLVRRINQDREVVTVAGSMIANTQSDGVGTNAIFYGVSSMCADKIGNIYLACYSFVGGTSVKRMTPALEITTLAGSFNQYGYTNGSGSFARFSAEQIMGICSVGQAIYVADSGNQVIRTVKFNPPEESVSDSNLSLELTPSLRITGTIGRAYRIESSTDTSLWQIETTILLNKSPYLWLDQKGTGKKKFYRAVLLP